MIMIAHIQYCRVLLPDGGSKGFSLHILAVRSELRGT
jgi:hypothetical protein